MGFRNRAHLIYDEFQQDTSSNITKDGQVVFIKTDFVSEFFNSILPAIDYNVTIITHNSDYNINTNYMQYIDNPKVISWYAQNVDVEHAKLKSIPLGIANRRWPHGNIEDLEEVKAQTIDKQHLVYMNFNANTNSGKRNSVTSLFSKADYVYSAANKSFMNYLIDLKSSKYVISPQGNGIDCHRTWEALLMGSVPIVERSSNISFYANLPILIIDNWASITEEFLEEKYKSFSFNTIEHMFIDFWIKEIGLLKEKRSI
tara:strand:+ start:7547 stop:8320 length:774 start_codon:yes stop_codon:yes gene_type:complete